MQSLRAARLASFSGLLFVALIVAAFVTLAAVGTEDGAPAAEWAEALAENGHFAQLSGYLHALAGLSLAAFVGALHALGARRAGGGLPAWGRFAGFAWAATFVAGGIVTFASAEMAGYQQHPEGAKTVIVLGHLLYANPVAALLGAALALATGLARIDAFPEWFHGASVAAGAIGIAITLLGSVGGIGLVAMGPVALWLLVASVLVPWRGGGARDPLRRA